jgi:hypothetical protein
MFDRLHLIRVIPETSDTPHQTHQTHQTHQRHQTHVLFRPHVVDPGGVAAMAIAISQKPSVLGLNQRHDGDGLCAAA